MAYEQRDNSGALFKNDRKQKETHPDYTGNCMVNGKTMRISAWIKQGKSGKFFSMAFSEPQSNSDEYRKQSGRSTQGGIDDLEDDVPW